MINMKKPFTYFLLLLVTFTSCQKQPLAYTQPEFKWPEGTGDYAPYTVGSSFTYEYTSVGAQMFTDEFTLKVTRDTLINGLKYYKLESDKPALVPSYFVNYNNGDITEITYNLNFLGAVTVPYLAESTLKEKATLNTVWNDPDVNLAWNGIPVNVKFEHSIIQKDFTREIFSKNYLNTIAVRELVSINLPAAVPFPPGIPSTLQYDNLYAKGAGLIQRNVSVGTSQKLKTFSIVK